MLNAIPVVGWVVTFISSVSLSVPFYFLWNHLAPRYLSFIPAVYQEVPFWDCVWIWMLVPMLGHLVQVLTPKVVSVSGTGTGTKAGSK